jgi:hypothetical protein
VSLVFTTYQAGKVFFIGMQPDGRLSVFERTAGVVSAGFRQACHAQVSPALGLAGRYCLDSSLRNTDGGLPGPWATAACSLSSATPSCAPLEVPWGKGNGLRVIGYYGVKVTVDLLPQKRWRQS